MSTEPRELFPLTFMGPKNSPHAARVETPDLDELPEPTAEELALLEAGGEPDAIPVDTEIGDPPVDPEPDLAGAVGKGQGAASKA